MKEKILAKIYKICTELKEPHECSCPSREDTFTEPQLNHLLRTVDIHTIFTRNRDGDWFIEKGINNCWYDLTKTVEQNLENEELANFIGEILFK
jgi:hypothetical protein